jgi:hypothetical protein
MFYKMELFFFFFSSFVSHSFFYLKSHLPTFYKVKRKDILLLFCPSIWISITDNKLLFIANLCNYPLHRSSLLCSLKSLALVAVSLVSVLLNIHLTPKADNLSHHLISPFLIILLLITSHLSSTFLVKHPRFYFIGLTFTPLHLVFFIYCLTYNYISIYIHSLPPSITHTHTLSLLPQRQQPWSTHISAVAHL